MNKMTSFQALVYSHLPMVVSVTETWLSDYIFDNEILPSGYNIFQADRPSRGGGVLLAVSSDLFCASREPANTISGISSCSKTFKSLAAPFFRLDDV